ncbi:sensor domain-containing diguanylate cyclase [Sphingomonas ginsenosidimutans]|jgi:diguanylate cyclase (GGDEF)-like protein|uniref:GGDEF domain-containing protein n=2 Tax=Sphingomonas TaxID=13687 RepID=UPI0008776383|nr:diguanylate cyclase [Sphingomonas ginsenosidimutans]MBY0300763.1 GGDEF domain-containing protein [Sphingomonas ginsenosidimutans]
MVPHLFRSWLVLLAAFVAAGVAMGWASPAAAWSGAPVATCLKRVAPGDTPAAIFAHPHGFDCSGRERRWGAGDFWVLSARLPTEGGQRSLVRSASVYQEAATLYARGDDGRIARNAFDRHNAWQRLRIGAFFELPIPVADTRTVQLLWRVEGTTNTRGVVLNPRLLTVGEGQRDDLMLTAFYAGFAGLCLSLLLSNFALWRALRQGYHPYYCAMILSLLVYAASSSGWLGIVTGMDNNIRLKLNIALLGGAIISAIAFARVFLGGQMMPEAVRRLTQAAMVFLAGAVATYLIVWPHWPLAVDRLLLVAFSAALALVVPVLWGAWRARVPYARIFAIAWSAPITLAMLRIVQAAGWIGWSFWLDNSTLVSMALEASFSALAIAWRIKVVSEERDAAREKETLARMLADSDALTGLLNRRSFLREAIGDPAPRLLVLIDIDHFRRVNETLGHDGGDEVLRVFAAALREAAPAGALIARMGGEEFAILVPAHLTGLPEQVLDTIRGAQMPFDLKVTASIGSALGVIGTEADWVVLYREADRALYDAKRAGRDRVRWVKAA